MAIKHTASDNIVSVAQQLENDGKITREACVAILKGDEDTYSEEMINAAQKVIRGQSPYFLSKSEIKALADQHNNQQPEPVRHDNTDDNFFGKMFFWGVAYATGMAPVCLALKGVDAIMSNKKTAAGLAAIGIAAFIGLDDIS